MSRPFVVFDIETAKEVPGEDFNWKPHRPLGISCAATLTSDSLSPKLWHGRDKNGKPAPHMSQLEVRELVEHLSVFSRKGYTVVSWNGLQFDFDILAEESEEKTVCRDLALGHTDLMFHAFCGLGYPVSLEKAAQGMGVAGKAAGMTGIQAPGMWKAGRFDEVLEYVAQDVRVTHDIALAAEKNKKLTWITRKGTKSSLALAQGWLAVQDALKLPEPDTSWMSNPLRRSAFLTWTKTA